MERKIGEIFEICGEWYQCVEGDWCFSCDLHKPNLSASQCDYRLYCFASKRKDNKSVIFKKIKKVGEPFIVVGKLYQYYKVFDIDNVCGDGFWCVHNYKAKTLTIEIKQNKEDMEEKKIHLKPFDIQKAREGKQVCTRDGRKARIICFDRKIDTPIVALIEHVDGSETLQCYFYNGKCCHNETSDYDLMMFPEKKEGWVNLYRDEESKRVYCGESIFSEREKAEKHYECNDTKVATVPVNWEE